MKTYEYPYYLCNFPEFNTAQNAVVPFFDKDVNLICSLCTGVGKTAIAECIFGYHLNTELNSKVIYVSPFKSIGGQKLDDWSKNDQLSKFGILLCDGDNNPKKEEWKRKRIITITYESLDSRTRNNDCDWLKDVSCVVFDEAHMLGQKDRGSKIESCLMRLTLINPKIRIVFLSGTMGNVIELAKWVKSLNGKETRAINSDWKPIKTILNFHCYDDSSTFKTAQKDKLNLIYSVIKEKYQQEKIIIFVHSKKMGETLIEFLKRKKIRCGFHNASVSKKIRSQLEKEFNREDSGFNLLISTSTLSTGTNL